MHFQVQSEKCLVSLFMQGKPLTHVPHSHAHTIPPLPSFFSTPIPAEPRCYDQELDVNLMLSLPEKPLSNHSTSLTSNSYSWNGGFIPTFTGLREQTGLCWAGLWAWAVGVQSLLTQRCTAAASCPAVPMDQGKLLPDTGWRGSPVKCVHCPVWSATIQLLLSCPSPSPPSSDGWPKNCCCVHWTPNH